MIIETHVTVLYTYQFHMTGNLRGLDEIASIVATDASDVKELRCPGRKIKHIFAFEKAIKCLLVKLKAISIRNTIVAFFWVWMIIITKILSLPESAY